MVMEPHTQLTTGDHAILQGMLERYKGPRGPFIQMLEQKMRSSAICFREDIPPGVVTLGTRLTYRINGILVGPHQITSGDGQDGSDSLSIQSSRGLALLGLAERATILVQLENGTEELFVEDVLSQPEAEEKARENSRGLVQADSSGRTSNVVSFQRKRAPMTFANHLPEDDDPGPSAA